MQPSLNAVKSGAYTDCPVIPALGETREQRIAELDRVLASYQPQNLFQLEQVVSMFTAHIRLNRLTSFESSSSQSICRRLSGIDPALEADPDALAGQLFLTSQKYGNFFSQSSIMEQRHWNRIDRAHRNIRNDQRDGGADPAFQCPTAAELFSSLCPEITNQLRKRNEQIAENAPPTAAPANHAVSQAA